MVPCKCAEGCGGLWGGLRPVPVPAGEPLAARGPSTAAGTERTEWLDMRVEGGLWGVEGSVSSLPLGQSLPPPLPLALGFSSLWRGCWGASQLALLLPVPRGTRSLSSPFIRLCLSLLFQLVPTGHLLCLALTRDQALPRSTAFSAGAGIRRCSSETTQHVGL